jgi:hypothetical protein
MNNNLPSRDLSMAIGVEEAAVTIRDYIENFGKAPPPNFMKAFDSGAPRPVYPA